MSISALIYTAFLKFPSLPFNAEVVLIRLAFRDRSIFRLRFVQLLLVAFYPVCIHSLFSPRCMLCRKQGHTVRTDSWPISRTPLPTSTSASQCILHVWVLLSRYRAIIYIWYDLLIWISRYNKEDVVHIFARICLCVYVCVCTYVNLQEFYNTNKTSS